MPQPQPHASCQPPPPPVIHPCHRQSGMAIACLGFFQAPDHQRMDSTHDSFHVPDGFEHFPATSPRFGPAKQRPPGSVCGSGPLPASVQGGSPRHTTVCPQHRGVLKKPNNFFPLKTALKDSPQGPPTANRHKPPTANHRRQPLTANRNQLSPTTNRQQPPTAYHCSILFPWSCVMKQRASP